MQTGKVSKEKDASSSGDEKKQRPIIKTPLDLQRLKLEKLMKNPDKPVVIPEFPPRNDKDFMLSVPNFVRNVMGSSAGAGSGEFHVYRHLRRKEYARQKCIQAKSVREQLDDEYRNKLEKYRLEAEAKTSKKREKRLKRKLKFKERGEKKKLKLNEVQQQQQKVSESNNSESDSEVNSKQKNKGKEQIIHEDNTDCSTNRTKAMNELNCGKQIIEIDLQSEKVKDVSAAEEQQVDDGDVSSGNVVVNTSEKEMRNSNEKEDVSNNDDYDRSSTQ